MVMVRFSAQCPILPSFATFLDTKVANWRNAPKLESLLGIDYLSPELNVSPWFDGQTLISLKVAQRKRNVIIYSTGLFVYDHNTQIDN
jgi:hypothetical protein